MQCAQCKITGFHTLNHEQMCVSCAKAKYEASVRNARKKISISIRDQFSALFVEWFGMSGWENSLPEHHSHYVIDAGDMPWVTWGDLDEYMATGEDRVRKWAPVCVDDKCGGIVTPEMADKFRSFINDLKDGSSVALVGPVHDDDEL
jgi:hypothetical protein